MECPNCGSSNCVARDGLQGICVDCDTVWDVEDGYVTFWGTPPEGEDDIVFVCSKCGYKNTDEHAPCDSCGWYEDEDYDPYSYIGWDGHEH